MWVRPVTEQVSGCLSASSPTTSVDRTLSLVSQICAFSLNPVKNRERVIIVIMSCVEVLPAAMPLRDALSSYPVEGNRLRFWPPLHFTHWIKDKIEAFLKDWVALEMNECMGLKTHELVYFFLVLFRSNY